MNLLDKIKVLANQYTTDVITWRRHLHAHPGAILSGI